MGSDAPSAIVVPIPTLELNVASPWNVDTPGETSNCDTEVIPATNVPAVPVSVRLPSIVTSSLKVETPVTSTPLSKSTLASKVLIPEKNAEVLTDRIPTLSSPVAPDTSIDVAVSVPDTNTSLPKVANPTNVLIPCTLILSETYRLLLTVV